MQRLELTWIGKGQEPEVEPRILLHDPSKDYGDPNSENMLIHGDNLLALKALEQQYAGQVKCIYIDPPYNTGAAFEHYDDTMLHRSCCIPWSKMQNSTFCRTLRRMKPLRLCVTGRKLLLKLSMRR